MCVRGLRAFVCGVHRHECVHARDMLMCAEVVCAHACHMRVHVCDGRMRVYTRRVCGVAGEDAVAKPRKRAFRRHLAPCSRDESRAARSECAERRVCSLCRPSSRIHASRGCFRETVLMRVPGEGFGDARAPHRPRLEASRMACLLEMFSSATGVRRRRLVSVYLTGREAGHFRNPLFLPPFSFAHRTSVFVSFSVGGDWMAAYKRGDSSGGNPTSVCNLQTWRDSVSSAATDIPQGSFVIFLFQAVAVRSESLSLRGWYALTCTHRCTEQRCLSMEPIRPSDHLFI